MLQASLVNLILLSTLTLVNGQLLTCLRSISGLDVVAPGDSDFYARSLGMNMRHEFVPAAVIFPTTTPHVQEAVRCASAAGVKVSPRSGGHSYEGYSQGGENGHLLVDLTNMNTVSVNSAAYTAYVGAGTRLGKLYVDVWDAGQFAFPGGSCPTVGIGGLVLGGGSGFLTNQFGLASDSVLEMEMVDAKGDVLVVNSSQNPDLFWALRGAGQGSFGIVVSFTIALQKVDYTVTNFYYSWRPARTHGRQITRKYTEWARTVPSAMTTGLALGDEEVMIYGLYLGSQSEITAVLNNLLSEIEPAPRENFVWENTLIGSHLSMSEMDSDDYQSLADPTMDIGYNYWKSGALLYSNPLSQDTVNILRANLRNIPSAGVADVTIDFLGGQNSNFPLGDSSYPHRDQLFSLQVYIAWHSPDSPPGLGTCPECVQWHRAFMDELYDNYRSEYGSEPKSYIGYIDNNLPNWQEAYYGGGFSRLVSIKTTYDPTDLFSFPKSIPTGSNPTPTTTTTSSSSTSSSSTASSTTSTATPEPTQSTDWDCTTYEGGCWSPSLNMWCEVSGCWIYTNGGWVETTGTIDTRVPTTTSSTTASSTTTSSTTASSTTTLTTTTSSTTTLTTTTSSTTTLTTTASSTTTLTTTTSSTTSSATPEPTQSTDWDCTTYEDGCWSPSLNMWCDDDGCWIYNNGWVETSGTIDTRVPEDAREESESEVSEDEANDWDCVTYEGGCWSPSLSMWCDDDGCLIYSNGSWVATTGTRQTRVP